jgi:hypothetical protein
MPRNRHDNEDGNSTSSSTCSPDNWRSNQSTVPGTPVVRTSFFLQRSPVATQQQGRYFLRSSPPRVATAEIVTAAVSNTASAASTAAAVSSTAPSDAASISAAVGIAALSRVASQGMAAAVRGRGRGNRSRVSGSAAVARGGGAGAVNRGGPKNYSDQEVEYMLQCIRCVLPLGHEMWDRVAELHGVHWPMQGRTAESLKRKFQTLANQQPGTGNPNIPPLVAKAKEIREAINVSAGVTDADVSEFFDEPDGGLLEYDEEEEVILEAPPAAAEVADAEAVPTVITAVARRQSTSSGPGSIATSVGSSKARTKQNQLVGAIEASNEVTSSAFATFLQQHQMAEEFEWRQRRYEREEERIRQEEERSRREEERARREEELHEMRRKESRQQEQMGMVFQAVV